ncbi:YfjP family GTPase, partial [Escherichia coli]|uniref:YfjP family GTPase n=1 Tax=Escherichia coli TaxID=562 RepID=UPI000A600707
MNPSDAIEAIEKPLSSLPYSLSRHILEHLRKLTSHEPVIGIMGKSGAGKSSLCNALFQGEVTPVSDVHAGTREVRRFRLSGHGHSMIITDLPGVGESRDRDAEYEALYRDILPELDLVLWLIKADDRALSVDEYFWRHILQAGHQGTGGMVGKRCHERTDQRIQFPAGAGRYGHNRMYGPEQPEYRICFLTNVLCLCGRRLNAGHIPFMAGLRFVGLRHHKQHLLMSPVQDVSPEILIHRQGTVIGFNQPQYQV